MHAMLVMMIREAGCPKEAEAGFSLITNPIQAKHEEHHHEMVYPQL
jgi:hypothetical protein